MHYIIGLLIVFIGTILVLKAEWFYENFGTISWAEEHMGTSGGSRLMYKLIGIFAIFIGLLVFTDLWNEFLVGTIGRLFIR